MSSNSVVSVLNGAPPCKSRAVASGYVGRWNTTRLRVTMAEAAG